MTDDIRAARARRATEARKQLINRSKAKQGRQGVTRARERVYAATHEALRAGLEASRGT